MTEDVLKDLRDRIEKTVDDLRKGLARIRTGRANTAMLEGVRVNYYGTPTPLSGVASVNVPEPRLITIKPWDKSVLRDIEKAIAEANLGFNPMNDGEMIRLPIPPLTEERRKEIAKLAGKYAEQQKIAVRNVRRDANDDLKKAEKDGVISQDEQKRMEAEVQKFTDEAVKRVDEALKTKEQEIMQV